MVQSRIALACPLPASETAASSGDGERMTDTLFEAYLRQYDDPAWAGFVAALRPSTHEVDRNATRIWFAFHPVSLQQALADAVDGEKLVRKLQLQGVWQLKDRIDSSHHFLYGHRYWPAVKQAVVERAESTCPPRTLNAVDQVLELAGEAAARLSVDRSLLVGIVAAALMTLQQVGLTAFRTASGAVHLDPSAARRTPDKVLRARARNDAQGAFGFLKGDRKSWTVTFDEQDPHATFRLINSQHLTTAAAADTRDHRARDPRCTEGPIPVECRTASCGTCWVGVLGGAEKLSAVDELERRRIREFGYIDTDEPKPIIRLACMAQAYGAVSIVIPSWNGIFGKYVRNQRTQAVETK